MLCYLRFPGRALRASERPPAILLAFVADQIRVLPDAIDEYLAAERTRQRQAVECQERLGLRPFGKRPAGELAVALLPQAIENDRLASLAEQVMQACRQRQLWSRHLPPWSGFALNSATMPAERRIAG